ncbi:MAG: D-alanyl-D-alanine carboxypeptidase [Selenomonadaceae bacterium]|nr:D-alanyl-D-alanine carboxypeptidase [Selenomonadaceae bacterium]
MKKIYAIILAGFFLLPCLLTRHTMAEEQEPNIAAKAAVVMEASTGRVIYAKNERERLYPASMTKMMTCILALEAKDEGKIVTVSPNAAYTESVPAGFQPGQKLTRGELLKALMIISDNGAAVALAEDIGDTVPLFSQMMNEKAKEIGCADTNFANPNGLPNPTHYSTALDMAKIAAYGMLNEQFRAMVGTRHSIMYWEAPRGQTLAMENTNELLGDYEGATGIKTGWTNAAGGCLAAAAKRDGLELIAVVMGAPTAGERFTDAKKVLDYGFGHARFQRGISKERVNKTVLIKDGADYSVTASPDTDINYVLLKDEKIADYGLKFAMERVVSAPVAKGQHLGDLVELYKGQEVARIPMRANEDVPTGFNFVSKFLVGALAFWLGK